MFGRRRRRLRATRPVLLAVAVFALSGLASPALGYSPSAAASYAEAHWNECGNSNYPCVSGADCTNFVSQALKAGAYPDVRSSSNGAAGTWWLNRSLPGPVYTWSKSWSFAQDLRTFLLLDSPGGTQITVRDGTSLAPDSGAGTGDVLFYDWNPATSDGGSEPWDHAAIIVANGTSVDGGYVGDLVDYHTKNRHHVFWTTVPYNTFARTTKISVIDVSASN